MTINPLNVTTYAIDTSPGADQTIVAGVSGQTWVIVKAMLCTAATNATIIVKSNATAITGTMPIPVNSILDLGDGSEALWVGRASGDAIKFTTATGDIDGYINVVWMK